MSKVKIGFTGLTVPEQIERARLIVTNMAVNANYTTPVPALKAVDAAITALENAYNASRSRDKNKVADMKLRKKELLFIITQLAAYVQEASLGDNEKIRSSGFDVVPPRTPHSDTAGDVINVRISDGTVKGSIRVDFDKADNAVIYGIVVGNDADFKNPEPKGITTKTHKEIDGFNSETRVWIRVIALGRENPGSFSEAVSYMVR